MLCRTGFPNAAVLALAKHPKVGHSLLDSISNTHASSEKADAERQLCWSARCRLTNDWPSLGLLLVCQFLNDGLLLRRKVRCSDRLALRAPEVEQYLMTNFAFVVMHPTSPAIHVQ